MVERSSSLVFQKLVNSWFWNANFESAQPVCYCFSNSAVWAIEHCVPPLPRHLAGILTSQHDLSPSQKKKPVIHQLEWKTVWLCWWFVEQTDPVLVHTTVETQYVHSYETVFCNAFQAAFTCYESGASYSYEHWRTYHLEQIQSIPVIIGAYTYGRLKKPPSICTLNPSNCEHENIDHRTIADSWPPFYTPVVYM